MPAHTTVQHGNRFVLRRVFNRDISIPSGYTCKIPVQIETHCCFAVQSGAMIFIHFQGKAKAEIRSKIFTERAERKVVATDRYTS